MGKSVGVYCPPGCSVAEAISGFAHFPGAMASAVSANQASLGKPAASLSISHNRQRYRKYYRQAQTGSAKIIALLSSPYPPQDSRLITKC